MRALTPPFGKYTAEEAALSGSLRHSHSRLSEFAEEVAFFGGEETERLIIERNYFGLIKHVNRVLRIRIWHGIVEEGIIKWLWGSFGVRPFDSTHAIRVAYQSRSCVSVQSRYFSKSLGPVRLIWVVVLKVGLIILYLVCFC